MLVKIIKCSNGKTSWYNNRIGEHFGVENRYSEGLRGNYWFVIDGKVSDTHFINEEDFEVLQEEKPILVPFTFEAWDKNRSQRVWTSGGEEVFCLAFFKITTDRFPLKGVFRDRFHNWTKEGAYYSEKKETHDFDLMLESTEKEYFVNVYRLTDVYLGCHLYKTFAEAEKIGKTASDYIKTISFKA